MGTTTARIEEMAPAGGSVCSSGGARGDGAQVLLRRWEATEEVRLGSTKLRAALASPTGPSSRRIGRSQCQWRWCLAPVNGATWCMAGRKAAARAARARGARGRDFIGAGGSAWRGAHAEEEAATAWCARHGLWWPGPDGPSRVGPEDAGRSRLGRVHGLGPIG
jgi:hypothetical protein